MEGTVGLYCAVLSNLLESYAAKHLITEPTADMMRFTHQSSISTVEYDEVLWNNVLKCNIMYKMDVLKVIFV